MADVIATIVNETVNVTIAGSDLLQPFVDAAAASAESAGDSAALAEESADSILPTVGISSRVTSNFEGYPDYWAVIVDTDGNLRLSQATDSRRFNHFNQDTSALSDRVEVIEAISPIGLTDAGYSSMVTTSFEGYPDRYTVVTDTDGSLRLVEAYDSRRFNVSLFGGISTTAGALPTVFDMFAVLGQSNADGRGYGGPALTSGIAYAWNGSALVALADPVGTDSGAAGSAWPAFAQSWYERTGRGVIIVPCARGGTTLIDSADSGNGSWGPTGGSFTSPTLRERAVSRINAAKAAATTAGIAHQFAGVLWSEGETCAGRITAGTTTSVAYSAGFEPLLTYIRTQTGAGEHMPWIIARTGFPYNTDTTGAQAVRSAQEQWCRDYSNVFMGWTGAITLPGRGLMLSTTAGELHYNQAGYNEMGISLAIVAQSVALGRC